MIRRLSVLAVAVGVAAAALAPASALAGNFGVRVASVADPSDSDREPSPEGASPINFERIDARYEREVGRLLVSLRLAAPMPDPFPESHMLGFGVSSGRPVQGPTGPFGEPPTLDYPLDVPGDLSGQLESRYTGGRPYFIIVTSPVDPLKAPGELDPSGYVVSPDRRVITVSFSSPLLVGRDYRCLRAWRLHEFGGQCCKRYTSEFSWVALFRVPLAALTVDRRDRRGKSSKRPGSTTLTFHWTSQAAFTLTLDAAGRRVLVPPPPGADLSDPGAAAEHPPPVRLAMQPPGPLPVEGGGGRPVRQPDRATGRLGSQQAALPGAAKSRASAKGAAPVASRPLARPTTRRSACW